MDHKEKTVHARAAQLQHCIRIICFVTACIEVTDHTFSQFLPFPKTTKSESLEINPNLSIKLFGDACSSFKV